MATGTRAQKQEEQMALLMQMINEGQQQLITQEQRAWREELVQEQKAQKDRQEKCEARLQKWQRT